MISSVNVTKSARNCGFATTTEEIPNGKLYFLCIYYRSQVPVTTGGFELRASYM